MCVCVFVYVSVYEKKRENRLISFAGTFSLSKVCVSGVCVLTILRSELLRKSSKVFFFVVDFSCEAIGSSVVLQLCDEQDLIEVILLLAVKNQVEVLPEFSLTVLTYEKWNFMLQLWCYC